MVQLYGRRTRYKEPGQVIAELETIYRLGWRGPVFVSDDNFIGSKGHARAILRELIPWNKSQGEPFGFTTQTTVSLGQDLALMDLMTQANFNEVFLGVESPDKEALSRVGNITISRFYAGIDSSDPGQWPVNHRQLYLGFGPGKPGAGDRIISFH